MSSDPTFSELLTAPRTRSVLASPLETAATRERLAFLTHARQLATPVQSSPLVDEWRAATFATDAGIQAGRFAGAKKYAS